MVKERRGVLTGVFALLKNKHPKVLIGLHMGLLYFGADPALKMK